MNSPPFLITTQLKALIWSERERARLLEYQLHGQNPKIMNSLVQPNNDDLSALHSDDEVSNMKENPECHLL